MYSPKRISGFTLIELLIVIAIIGTLSSVVLASLNMAREKAKISLAASQFREIERQTRIYQLDTGRMPPDCGYSCTPSNDPFLNSLGIEGWDGPYFSGISSLTHPWGGHFAVRYGSDVTGDGIPDSYIFLDDDRPGSGSSDNSGVIPEDSLIRIDAILDDGVLSTGSMRANGEGYASALGEAVILIQ